jgi:hypothetical protein
MRHCSEPQFFFINQREFFRAWNIRSRYPINLRIRNVLKVRVGSYPERFDALVQQ